MTDWPVTLSPVTGVRYYVSIMTAALLSHVKLTLTVSHATSTMVTTLNQLKIKISYPG